MRRPYSNDYDRERWIRHSYGYRMQRNPDRVFLLLGIVFLFALCIGGMMAVTR